MHYATAAAQRCDCEDSKGAPRERRREAPELGPRGYLDSAARGARRRPRRRRRSCSRKPACRAGGDLNSRTPRAIYFNDDVYVAWVQNGPRRDRHRSTRTSGPCSTPLDNPVPAEKKTRRPSFARQVGRCLSCHDSYSLSGGGVPALHCRLGAAPGPLGQPRRPLRAGDPARIDQHAFGEPLGRLGTLTGKQRRAEAPRQRADPQPSKTSSSTGSAPSRCCQPRQPLDALFDTKPYLTDKSDIVALMILEHEVNAQNAITRVSFLDVLHLADRPRARREPRERWLPASRRGAASATLAPRSRRRAAAAGADAAVRRRDAARQRRSAASRASSSSS